MIDRYSKPARVSPTIGDLATVEAVHQRAGDRAEDQVGQQPGQQHTRDRRTLREVGRVLGQIRGERGGGQQAEPVAQAGDRDRGPQPAEDRDSQQHPDRVGFAFAAHRLNNSLMTVDDLLTETGREQDDEEEDQHGADAGPPSTRRAPVGGRCRPATFLGPFAGIVAGLSVTGVLGCHRRGGRDGGRRRRPGRLRVGGLERLPVDLGRLPRHAATEHRRQIRGGHRPALPVEGRAGRPDRRHRARAGLIGRQGWTAGRCGTGPAAGAPGRPGCRRGWPWACRCRRAGRGLPGADRAAAARTGCAGPVTGSARTPACGHRRHRRNDHRYQVDRHRGGQRVRVHVEHGHHDGRIRSAVGSAQSVGEPLVGPARGVVRAPSYPNRRPRHRRRVAPARRPGSLSAAWLRRSGPAFCGRRASWSPRLLDLQQPWGPPSLPGSRFGAGPRARRSASSSAARSIVRRLDLVTLAQRRVGLAVGDVRPEPAVLDHHRLAAGRVGADLTQRRRRGGGTAALSWAARTAPAPPPG